MSASLSVFCFSVLACFVHCGASEGDVKANRGDDVILQCQDPRDAAIVLLRWRRPDLGSDEYVFYFRQNHTNDEYQHESFHGRVKLRDPTMKDGDASVILKNVDINDNGIYECYVGVMGRSPELINTVTLKVEPLEAKITAEPGQNVTLTCEAPVNIDVTAVKWIRPDLEPDSVFLFQDGQTDPENQHPSFRNRVELKDKQMKDGDVSVILKNVMFNDTGTYECHVVQGETNRRKRSSLDTPPLSIINLTVQPGHNKDGGDKDGGDKDVNVGLAVGLSVVLLVVAALVALCVYKQPKGQNLYQQPAEREAEQQV